jgi:hypothetical protein
MSDVVGTAGHLIHEEALITTSILYDCWWLTSRAICSRLGPISDDVEVGSVRFERRQRSQAPD